MRVLIDGRAVPPEEATLSLFDQAFLRGAGAFEAVRSYGGAPFEVERHLDRLENSARSLGVPLPSRAQLRAWIDDVARSGGDCLVRVLATPGGSCGPHVAPPRLIVLEEPLPELPTSYRLIPLLAPWHPAGEASALEGVKSLSYGPNLAAQHEAQRRGFDDALLLSRDGLVLELPMASVAWIKDGALLTPALSLGVLASVTRAVLLEEARALGWEVHEVRAALSELEAADEVMILSTSRQVRPVAAVGERTFVATERTKRLRAAYLERATRREGDVGRSRG